MTLLEEIEQGESTTLELKLQLPEHDQIAKTVVAFANTQGGKLIVGVDDDRHIVGVPDALSGTMMQQIRKSLAEKVRPPADLRLYRRRVLGHRLIVIDVTPDDRTHHLILDHRDLGPYIRVGDVNRPVQTHS